MITQREADSIYSVMYKLRDALNENNLPYALVLSKEIHEMVLAVVSCFGKVDCDLKSTCNKLLDDREIND